MHPVGKIAPGKNHGFKLVFPKLVSSKLKRWSNKLLCLLPAFRKLPGSPDMGSWGRKGCFQSLLITQRPAPSWFQFPSGEKQKGTRQGWDIHLSRCVGCFARRSILCFNLQESHFELWFPFGAEKASAMFWFLTYLPKTLIDHPLFPSHLSLGQ